MGLDRRSVFAVQIAAASLLAAEPSLATTVVDPAGDILSTYVGPVGPGLDILGFTAEIQGTNFWLQALLDGPVATTTANAYIIGIDRGSGTNVFGSFRPGTSVDATVVITPTTLTGNVLLFVGGAPVTTTPLASGAVSASGNTISVLVPISMLPSNGFAQDQYTFLLWARTPSPGMPTLGIADFAPNQGQLSLVPEPSTWIMMLIGFGGVGLVTRRSRKRSRSLNECA